MSRLPDPADMQGVFRNLYGYAVEVKPGAKAAGPNLITAVYAEDNGKPAILCIADLAFASKSGAALTLIPPKLAEESIQAGKLSDDLLENYHEVLNVLGGLLNQLENKHVKLQAVYLPGQPVPESDKRISDHPGQQRHYEIMFKQYGLGKVSWLDALNS